MQNTQAQMVPAPKRGEDSTNDRRFTKLEFHLMRRRGRLVQRRRIRVYLLNNGSLPWRPTWRPRKSRHSSTVFVVAVESTTLVNVLRKMRLLPVLKKRVEYCLRFSRTGYFP